MLRATPLRLALPLCFLLGACSHGVDLAPVASDLDAGSDAPDDAADAGPDAPADAADAGSDAPDTGPPLGKPCTADADCGDDIDCTVDACDQAEGRCRNSPDDARCADSSACNGVEACDPLLGCRPGEPVTCSDGDACTIDKCVEDAQGVRCDHAPRDADGDGDPDHNCTGGKDCDDTDPLISSLALEICANGRDDNCDGVVDGADCHQPAHDTCTDPLVLPQPGTYTLSMAGAKLDTSATCAPAGVASLRDVIAGVTVPPGPPQRVDIRATWPYGINAAALSVQCGVAATELACNGSQPNTTNGGQIARLRAHSVQPGVYPLALYGYQDYDVTVSYDLAPADEPPTNETCGTALPLAPDTPVLVPLVGASPDVPMLCGNAQAPDLVYRLDLDKAYDVSAFASPADGVGDAVVSVRRSACAGSDSEAACASGDPASAFARKLGPGPVYLAVSSSTHGDVNLLASLSPPTEPPADESCSSGPPVLTLNKDRTLDLTHHADDHQFCASGLLDAAFALPLTQPSDVLLVLRTSQSTSGAISLATPTCELGKALACKAYSPSPLRAALHNVPTGAYRVVAELNNPTPAELLPLVRKASPPVLVPFADACSDALAIPPDGGSFQGNTANVNAQFTASCDQGNAPNSPDQLLRLELTAKKRVILDMDGSTFPTLLDVRRGPDCPGKEVDLGCTIGTYPQRSFLDLTLDAGVYFLQIDGFNGASGSWFLDVFVVDP